MTSKTHIAAGTLTASLLCIDWISALLVVIGSILPDIDHGSSIMGKNIPLIHKLFKHRGITHSLLFCVLVGVFNIWLAVGIGVHIITDMMTKQGVTLYFPLKNKINFYPMANMVKTNGLFEKAFCYLCYIGIIIVISTRIIF